MNKKRREEQGLYLVFGGELESVTGLLFRDLNALDIVGIFPDYFSAYSVWKAKAQQTVDDAHVRYFIVNINRLLHSSMA